MRNRIHSLGVLVALAVLQACAPPENGGPEQETRSLGRLVIVGGALQADNAAVYEAVVEARAGDGPLCVVPTASEDAAEAMEEAVEKLAGYAGAGMATGVFISTGNPSAARDPSVAADLAACSGFYFTGGSQSRIADVFLPAGDTTEAYRALWERWQQGAVVAGSSAGAAMMSRLMISGGGSAEAVTHGVARGEDAEGVEIRGGMGFFEPILDQHFLARGRIGRLLVTVIQEDLAKIGLGIDENTALVVDGDSAVVVGASGVVVADGRSATRTDHHRATGLRVSLAGAGDVLDLRTLDVRSQEAKVPVPLRDSSVDLPEEPFARWAFLHVIAALAGTEQEEAVFALPGATLRIAEGPGFTASMTGTAGGVESTPYGLSAGPFIVALQPAGP